MPYDQEGRWEDGKICSGACFLSFDSGVHAEFRCMSVLTTLADVACSSVHGFSGRVLGGLPCPPPGISSDPEVEIASPGLGRWSSLAAGANAGPAGRSDGQSCGES